jgi:hypothetical protein
MDKFLKKIIQEKNYYNLTNMPFDYIQIITNESIVNQIRNVHKAANEDFREEEKYNLLKLIYTEIYKLNLTKEEIKTYLNKAILTNRYKTYLGIAFKFSLQYNPEEDTIQSTFIHLAQLFISDICYEYLWKLDNA